MKKIKLLNKIAPIGLDQLDKNTYITGEDFENPDAILVRSAIMNDMVFGEDLLAIARCGAGVNNIPVDKCAESGIVVFNTPGANANGVKELAVAALILASRDIVGGIGWANTLTEDVAKKVEAGKSKFAGHEIEGKTLGVIGLGAIGGMVANTAHNLGMAVIGCDPYITIEAAWGLSRAVKKAVSYADIYKEADYITIHVPATSETKNMINADTIATMKDGVKIINLSRADLVNTADIKAAIASGKVSCYVTDFPTDDTVGVPGIIAIPHLGASTEESEDNCAVMAARQLVDFMENGNIVNSVNFPSVSMPRSGGIRLTILHKNIPNMLSHISTSLSSENINIENMTNRSKGNYACTIVDIGGAIENKIIEKIKAMDGIIKVYIIK